MSNVMCNKVAKFIIEPDFSNIGQLEATAMYSDDCPIHDIIYTLSDGSTDRIRIAGGPIITTTILNMVKGAVIRMGIIKNPPYVCR